MAARLFVRRPTGRVDRGGRHGAGRPGAHPRAADHRGGAAHRRRRPARGAELRLGRGAQAPGLAGAALPRPRGGRTGHLHPSGHLAPRLADACTRRGRPRRDPVLSCGVRTSRPRHVRRLAQPRRDSEGHAARLVRRPLRRAGTGRGRGTTAVRPRQRCGLLVRDPARGRGPAATRLRPVRARPGHRRPAHRSPTRRAQVSRAAGWISPTVVTGAGVVGTWRTTSPGSRSTCSPTDHPSTVACSRPKPTASPDCSRSRCGWPCAESDLVVPVGSSSAEDSPSRTDSYGRRTNSSAPRRADALAARRCSWAPPGSRSPVRVGKCSGLRSATQTGDLGRRMPPPLRGVYASPPVRSPSSTTGLRPAGGSGRSVWTPWTPRSAG